MTDLDPQIKDAFEAVSLSPETRARLARMADEPPRRSHRWLLGLAIAATIGLAAWPLVPSAPEPHAASALPASTRVLLAPEDAVWTGDVEAFAMEATGPRSLGTFTRSKAEDLLEEPAVKSLPGGTVVRVLGVIGGSRGFLLPGPTTDLVVSPMLVAEDPNDLRPVFILNTTATHTQLELPRHDAVWALGKVHADVPLSIVDGDQGLRAVSIEVPPRDTWIARGERVQIAIVQPRGVHMTLEAQVLGTGDDSATLGISPVEAEWLVEAVSQGGTVRLVRLRGQLGELAVQGPLRRTALDLPFGQAIVVEDGTIARIRFPYDAAGAWVLADQKGELTRPR